MIPFGPDYSTGWSNTFCSLEVETRRTSLSISLSPNSFERERERWTLIWGVCVFFSFIVLKLLPFLPFIHRPVVLIKDKSLTPNFLLLLFLTLWLVFCRRRPSSFLSIFFLAEAPKGEKQSKPPEQHDVDISKSAENDSHQWNFEGYFQLIQTPCAYLGAKRF